MTSPAHTILGFDFGTQKIGVAVGQSITQTVTPLVTLISQNQKPDWAAIEKLIAEWQPNILVVGLPVHLDGKEQSMTQAARKFGNRLNGRFQLPVEFMDERLSSYEAEERLKECKEKKINIGKKHTNKRQTAMDIDKIAAQLIVESWFQQAAQ